jgi:hypothetical protein
MRTACNGLFVLFAAAVLGGSASAQVPNFNKRGTGEKEEKAFVEKVAQTIVGEARTSAKEITLKEHKFVEPKSGRKQLRMSVGYKGALTSTRYTADVTVELDTSVPDKWEVLRIDYTDNNKNIVGWNRKNVEALVKKFNEAR